MGEQSELFNNNFFFEPDVVELEVSTNSDTVLEYENNILDYDDDQSHNDESIEEEDVDGLERNLFQRSSLLANLLLVEPITTAQRLAAYPEMRMIRPRRARDIFPYEAPPPATESSAKEIGAELEAVIEEPTADNTADAEANKKSDKSNRAPLQCTECGYCYRSEIVLANHQKLHEQNLSIPVPGFLCPMDECGIRCDCQTTLNDHVRFEHGQTDVVDQTLFFPNWAEFDHWKDTLEESTKTRFVRASNKYNLTGRSTRYNCFFTNPYLRPLGRGIRQRPSRKREEACTAYMTTRESYGKIVVTACLKHIGHEKDAQQLPLSTPIRREIATLVMQGLKEDEIVETMRESSTPDNRRYYIQSYEVRNVCKKLLMSQYKADRMIGMMQAAVREKNEPPRETPEVVKPVQCPDKKDDKE